MAPELTLQPAHIATTDYAKPEQGFLIFAADALVAVISQLDGSLEQDGDLRGRWFLEVGFGPCAVAPSNQGTFSSRHEAEDWVLRRVLKTSVQSKLS